jgi:uncharacterized membrane protein
MRILETGLRAILAVFMIFAGMLHFVRPAPFVGIVPAYLPAPLLLVHVSGVAEIAGGLGLLVARTRRAAAWGLIALYVAVFPANINQAVHHIPFGDKPVPELYLWLRLPFQLVFISLAYWFARPDRKRRDDH